VDLSLIRAKTRFLRKIYPNLDYYRYLSLCKYVLGSPNTFLASPRAGFHWEALTVCKVHAEVPWEWVLKRGKAGQSDTSECSWEPGTRGTEGLASARRLRPHGMPMPYFGWTRLGEGPAGTR